MCEPRTEQTLPLRAQATRKANGTPSHAHTAAEAHPHLLGSAKRCARNALAARKGHADTPDGAARTRYRAPPSSDKRSQHKGRTAMRRAPYLTAVRAKCPLRDAAYGRMTCDNDHKRTPRDAVPSLRDARQAANVSVTPKRAKTCTHRRVLLFHSLQNKGNADVAWILVLFSDRRVSNCRIALPTVYDSAQRTPPAAAPFPTGHHNNARRHSATTPPGCPPAQAKAGNSP